MRISDWSSDVCSSDLVARSLVVTRALPPAEGPSWYVQEAPTPITVDGYGDDWAPLTPWSQPFARRGRLLLAEDADRSEERRVGEEGVSTCRSRGSTYH